MIPMIFEPNPAQTKAIKQLIAEEIVPTLRESIDNAAFQFALSVNPNASRLVSDEVANLMMRLLCEFITTSNLNDNYSKLHIRRLSETDAKDWFELE